MQDEYAGLQTRLCSSWKTHEYRALFPCYAHKLNCKLQNFECYTSAIQILHCWQYWL